MMMPRDFAILGCAALLGACAAPDKNLVAAQQHCATAASVLQEITCTRTRLEAEQWRQSPIANDIATYLAYADSLAEKVRAGRMTDGDARQDLRQMLQRLRSELQSAAPLPGAGPS
jgi:hypothetical protein